MIKYTEADVRKRIKEIEGEPGTYQEGAIDFWFGVLSLFRLTNAPVLGFLVEDSGFSGDYPSFIYIYWKDKLLKEVPTKNYSPEFTYSNLISTIAS